MWRLLCFLLGHEWIELGPEADANVETSISAGTRREKCERCGSTRVVETPPEE